MAKRIGSSTIQCSNPISIREAAGVAGQKESQGPLGSCFDKTYQDDLLGRETWEQAESALQSAAVSLMLEKAALQPDDIDVILAGDLLNQCISSTFGLKDLHIPFLGQYGACSTMAQTIAVSSLLTDSGAVNRAAAVTSSHFCSAERQFRLPLAYGGQRTPSAQWTVTGAGAALLDRSGCGPFVREITIGRIYDLHITDANNMGAAMAPAAADTLLRFFGDTGESPAHFDLILTGDLGKVGSALLLELLQREGLEISAMHRDCGLMIFDPERQDVHAGGSGCGCSGSVFCSHIVRQLKQQQLHNILFIATGALMSPTSSQQGESIPGIAHLLHITSS